VPRIVDHDAERRVLARRSTDLFARHGYAGLSMRAAAEELGVSTGTLYHYFNGKDDLFAAVVDATVDADVLEAMAGLSVAGVPPALRLRAIFAYAQTTLPRLVRDYRVFVEFAAHASSNARVDELVRHSRARYLDTVMRVLDLRDRARADIVLLALCGLILRAMCGDDSTDVEDVCRALDPILGGDST